MAKSKKWEVDHSYDASEADSVDHIPQIEEDSEIDVSDQLETPEEKKARKRSHWVAYATMFVMCIGFSIVVSGVWPYMQKIQDGIDKSQLGWVISANPFGQMLGSPLLGFWGNKAGSIRGACITTIIFFIGGNIMYACLYAFSSSKGQTAFYMMILSRFVVGVSSANITLCRSYIAESTTFKERTTGIAIIAAAQALGYVVGPGIQSLLVVVVKEPVYTSVPGIVWDEYTSCGWVAALLGFINLIIVMPCIFTEYKIAAKEQALLKRGMDDNVAFPKPDYTGIAGILFAFYCDFFIYVLLETLAEPFVQDMYAVDDHYAVVAVGVALMAGGLLSTLMYAVTSRLAKKYDERKLLIFMGMIPTVIGTFLYLPWGDHEIVMQNCTTYEFNATLEYTSTSTVSPYYDYTNCTLGCPLEQDWCNDVPMIPVAQLLVAYGITISAFPVIQAMCQTIYSKMLGPKPQGLWMGILTGTGSFARVTGPIFVSYVYTYNGTYWTFGILEIAMIVALGVLLLVYPRMVPMKLIELDKETAYDKNITDFGQTGFDNKGAEFGEKNLDQKGIEAAEKLSTDEKKMP